MKNLELATISTFAGRVEIVKSNGKSIGFVVNTKPGIWLAFHASGLERPCFVGRFTSLAAKACAVRRILKVHTLGWIAKTPKPKNLHKL